MPPTIMHLFDPAAAGLVLAGTAVATVARCGLADCGAALGAVGALVRRPFRSEPNRRALAQALSAIARDGHHRADPALPPDRPLALMLDAYLRHGTLDGVGAVRRAKCAVGDERRARAVQVFVAAGELAPVFGLIGTLLGLAGLAPIADSASPATQIMGAVSVAVLTSLYGALLAHLLCHPLASAIERRGLADEQAREALAEWFAAQIAQTDATAQARRARLRGVA